MADGESSLETERRLANLVLVIESLLERLHDGESVDRSLLVDVVDVVDYAADYLDRVHESRERRALEAVATVVPASRGRYGTSRRRPRQRPRELRGAHRLGCCCPFE